MPQCKKFICQPDNCSNPTWYDELSGTNAEQEDVKIDNSTDLKNPAAPYIKLGSVTFTIKWILDEPLGAEFKSAQLSPEIALTNPKIPQSIIDAAKDWINDEQNGVKAWLEAADPTDALVKFWSTNRTQEATDIIDASAGYRFPEYLSAGDKYGSPVVEKEVTIDYYTTGKFEGCEAGTSDSYGEDNYPCGYGKFTIDNKLYFARPDFMEPITFPSWDPPYRNLNPLTQEALNLLEPAAAALAPQANAYLNSTYLCRDFYNCWAYVNGQASIGNSNGFLADGNQLYLFGNGAFSFYGQVNFADPDPGNSALAVKASPMFFDPSLYEGQFEPYDPRYYGVAWNVYMVANLKQIAEQNLQLLDVPNQVINTLSSLFNQTKNSTTTTVIENRTIIEVLSDTLNGQGNSEGKAQGSATLQGDQTTIKVNFNIFSNGQGGFGGGQN